MISAFVFAMVTQPRLQNKAFEDRVVRYETEDKTNPPKPEGIVFAGSSSIEFWKTLKQDFPGQNVINRGISGCHISDDVAFVDRIVTPYKPKLVVFFAGTNDIAGGKSAETVFNDYKTFVASVHAKLPATRIAFIAVTPAPSRMDKWDVDRAANRLIADYSLGDPSLIYVDAYSPMVTPEGGPRNELFNSDRLHPNALGYAIWKDLITPLLPWN